MFKFLHNNLNVLDLERSLKFYREALGLEEVGRLKIPGATLVYLGDGGRSPHQLELTWVEGRTEPYNLGENELHLAFETDDYEAAHARHEAMGCICFENKELGIYFIVDPDGWWLEVLPRNFYETMKARGL